MLIETTAQTTAPAPAPSRIGRRFVGQVCLVLLMITIVLSGFFFTNWNQQALIDVREGGRQMRIAQEALLDAERDGLNQPVRLLECVGIIA